MKISESVVIVTGGASGLGEAVCRHLAEQGAYIVVMDKSEKANQLANEIQGLAAICDITQSAPLQKTFLEIAQKIPRRLSVIVNCAGIASAKRMVGIDGPVDLAWFQEVININLVGSFNVMRLSAKLMIDSIQDPNEDNGVIINTASMAAFEGQIGQTAYSASKGGIVAMTLPAARELAQFGIRVMAIAPGLMDTPMLQSLSDKAKASLTTQTLFPKRFGQPIEYAQLVAQIISNSLLNAEVIRLDGGMRMQSF